MLSWLSGFRPHSSPDPLTRATLSPGEGIFTAPTGRKNPRPRGEVARVSGSGEECGRKRESPYNLTDLLLGQ